MPTVTQQVLGPAFAAVVQLNSDSQACIDKADHMAQLMPVLSVLTTRSPSGRVLQYSCSELRSSSSASRSDCVSSRYTSLSASISSSRVRFFEPLQIERLRAWFGRRSTSDRVCAVSFPRRQHGRRHCVVRSTSRISRRYLSVKVTECLGSKQRQLSGLTSRPPQPLRTVCLKRTH